MSEEMIFATVYVYHGCITEVFIIDSEEKAIEKVKEIGGGVGSLFNSNEDDLRVYGSDGCCYFDYGDWLSDEEMRNEEMGNGKED